MRGWQRQEINGIEYELNSIITEKYTYRCILTNDYTSTNREIVEFYNLRGGKERIFDEMTIPEKRYHIGGRLTISVFTLYLVCPSLARRIARELTYQLGELCIGC